MIPDTTTDRTIPRARVSQSRAGAASGRDNSNSSCQDSTGDQTGWSSRSGRTLRNGRRLATLDLAEFKIMDEGIYALLGHIGVRLEIVFR